MAGRNFCVRYGEHRQVETCHHIGQAVLIDNGAFSQWTKGSSVDWKGYYEWVEPWLDYHTTWAVIPDVIGGTEDENYLLVCDWPHGHKGAPVWHMHESLDHLGLLLWGHERVCIGSSGEYADPGSSRWAWRMDEAWNRIAPNCAPDRWIHMLRAMEQACMGDWPFASTDSTNTAQNHHRHSSPRKIAEVWDARQAPARWTVKPVQEELAA